MTKKELLDIAAKLMPQFSPGTLSADMQALLGAEEFTFFDMPLIGFAAADDPLFEKFKEEGRVTASAPSAFLVAPRKLRRAPRILSGTGVFYGTCNLSCGRKFCLSVLDGGR